MSAEVFTVADVAGQERCSRETILRAIRRGELAARTLNPGARSPRYRITQVALDEWRADRDRPRAITPEPPAPVDATSPPLSRGPVGRGFTGTLRGSDAGRMAA